MTSASCPAAANFWTVFLGPEPKTSPQIWWISIDHFSWAWVTMFCDISPATAIADLCLASTVLLQALTPVSARARFVGVMLVNALATCTSLAWSSPQDRLRGSTTKPGKSCDELVVCYLFVGFTFIHVAPAMGLGAFGRLNKNGCTCAGMVLRRCTIILAKCSSPTHPGFRG